MNHEQQALANTYQKKSDSEHVLARPDNYVGEMRWVEYTHRWCVGALLDPNTKTQQLCLVQSPIKFCHALFQLFEEALMNPMDQYQRYPLLVTEVRVTVDEKLGQCTIRNNGPPIDVAIHPTYKTPKGEPIWIPSFLFGESRTSRNYNDTEERKTGGRNGVGIKVVNALCVYFKVTIYDGTRALYFEQEWKNNMTIVSPPSVRPVKDGDGKSFVEISFIPDYARFSEEGNSSSFSGMTPELLNTIRKRVWEMAVTNVFESDSPKTHAHMNVYWNNELVTLKTPYEYIHLYRTLDNNTPFPVQWMYETTSSDGQIAIGLNRNSSSGFQQISFVNNICTYEGGTHVSCVMNQICPPLIAHVEKKVTDGKLSRALLEKNLILFVNLRMDKPEFEHQTKKRLTSVPSKFSSFLQVPPSFISSLIKNAPLMERLIALANKKAKQSLKQMDGKKNVRYLDIDKLEDAPAAGGPQSQLCTLIITEGDSAKALAMAGLSAIPDQRDYYGVFPIRGKFINVCECSNARLEDNHEFKSIVRILGLKFDEKTQQSRSSLRYGRMVIMTDQDDDGSHIKGLLVNLFRVFWPTIFKDTGFLCEFQTPLVKAKRGKIIHTFYNMSTYLKWKNENNQGRGWDIKYYKGLGTSTAQEGKEYFLEMDKHIKPFVWESEKDTEAIAMAFDKDASAKRGEWLDKRSSLMASKSEEEMAQEKDQQKYTFSNFIDNQWYAFAMAANERSMTSLVDGFTIARRKLFHMAWKNSIKKDIKVAALVGRTIEDAGYHRGEMSLAETACKMAQSYVGSNNLNLLVPSGQFGTREETGDDAASSRYIFTHLSPLAEFIFSHDDDPLLPKQFDDGKPVEPKWFLPVFPLCLTNPVTGGIGMGKKSDVPGYHPLHVVQQLYARLTRSPNITPLVPWYQGFKGTITPLNSSYSSFLMRGKWEWKTPLALHITEIPVGRSIASYKEFLKAQKDGTSTSKKDHKGKKKSNVKKEPKEPSGIVSIENTGVDDQVSLTIHFENEEAKQKWCKDDEMLCKKFQLDKIIRTNHLQLFDERGCLTKYRDPGHMIDEFIKFRYPYYEKRRIYMLEAMKHKWIQMSAQARFIEMVNETDEKKILHIHNVAEEVLLAELARREFPLVYGRVKKVKEDIKEDKEEKEEGEEKKEQIVEPKPTMTLKELDHGYTYLTSLPISKLTLQQSKRLHDSYLKLREEYDVLEKKAAIDLWMYDINQFIAAWHQLEKEKEQQYKESHEQITHRQSKRVSTTKTKNNKIGGKRKTIAKSSSSASASASS